MHVFRLFSFMFKKLFFLFRRVAMMAVRPRLSRPKNSISTLKRKLASIGYNVLFHFVVSVCVVCGSMFIYLKTEC
jgi:hypothetical protein